MQSYKIDMKESELPVLLTKSILYNLIHRLFTDQFQMLTMDGEKCFVQVKMLKQDSRIKYCFKCSIHFYRVCNSDPKALDLSRFA